jgi:hypothetical protein
MSSSYEQFLKKEVLRVEYCKGLRAVLQEIPATAPEPLQELKRKVLLQLLDAEPWSMEFCRECGCRFDPEVEFAADSALGDSNKCDSCNEYMYMCLKHHDGQPPHGLCYFCKFDPEA